MAKAKATEKEVDVADNTFDPETQIVVNKKKFEELIFNLTTSRTQMLIRQGSLNVIAGLLDLPGGPAEARDVLTAIMTKVTNP